MGDHLAKCKADKNDEATWADLSASVSAAQGLLQEKTSDGSNLVTVTIGRDKLNTSMKKATAYLAALAKEKEDLEKKKAASKVSADVNTKSDATSNQQTEAK